MYLCTDAERMECIWGIELNISAAGGTLHALCPHGECGIGIIPG